MKSLKIVFVSLFVVGSVITLSSFVSNGFKKNAFSVVCKYYNGTNKTIGSLDETAFKTASNWVGTPSQPPADCNTGSFLCAVCFDDEDYTLAQALTAGWSYYIDQAPDNLPHGSNISLISGSSLYFYRQSTTANH